MKGNGSELRKLVNERENNRYDCTILYTKIFSRRLSAANGIKLDDCRVWSNNELSLSCLKLWNAALGISHILSAASPSENQIHFFILKYLLGECFDQSTIFQRFPERKTFDLLTCLTAIKTAMGVLISADHGKHKHN